MVSSQLIRDVIELSSALVVQSVRIWFLPLAVPYASISVRCHVVYAIYLHQLRPFGGGSMIGKPFS